MRSGMLVKISLLTYTKILKIRSFLKETLKVAGVSKIETERSKNRLRLTIHTAKPGMVIGRGGSGIEQLKKGLKKIH